MKRLVCTVGLVLLAQTAWADVVDAPKPRPGLCRMEDSTQVFSCTVLVKAAYQPAAPTAPRVMVKQRKIVRLPWTIGAFQ